MNQMANVFQSLLSFVLVFPIVIFLVIFLITVKVSGKRARAFGYAADVTTFLLFFAVPIAIQSLFSIEAMGIIFCIALVMSAVLTVMEWKSKKEIELQPLLRKIWRFLFLVLSVTYLIVWCIGLVYKVLEYIS